VHTFHIRFTYFKVEIDKNHNIEVQKRMITLRKAEERGHFNHGWLNTSHTFSFGQYYDPNQMGFRSLRVINQDQVIPSAGFGTHGHRDMEIITYVLEGALEHKDSLGTGAVIHPGEVQRMSAGTGIRHSEFNHSKTEPVYLLQIWILPEKEGLTPSYEQRYFPLEEKRGKLRLVAARDGREGAVTVHQDVELYASVLEPGFSQKSAFGRSRVSSLAAQPPRLDTSYPRHNYPKRSVAWCGRWCSNQ